MGCHTYDWLIEGGNGVPNNYLDDGEAAFAREFPELEEMLRDEEDKSEDYQHPSSTTFLPFIRTVQRIVLYETKSVSYVKTNSLRRGPSGPSSLAPATQDKMHPFIIIQWS